MEATSTAASTARALFDATAAADRRGTDPTLQYERSFCIVGLDSNREDPLVRLTWLGWAGTELEADGATLVIDPLEDPGAVFAPFGAQGAAAPLPTVVPASPARAVAGLLTHLHRDHADASALAAALSPGAPVLEPPAGDGDAPENLALAQAEHELSAAGLARSA